MHEPQCDDFPFHVEKTPKPNPHQPMLAYTVTLNNT